MVEVQDTQYGIVIDATGKIMMVAREWELSGTLNADKAIRLKDAVFVSQVVFIP